MTAVAGRIRAKSASVNSGLSGSVAAAAATARSSFRLNRTSLGDFFLREFFISPYLPIIGLTQADDPNLSCTTREHHHVKPQPDRTYRYHSPFAISPPEIRRNERRFPNEAFRVCEVHSMLGKVGGAFGFVPGILSFL